MRRPQQDPGPFASTVRRSDTIAKLTAEPPNGATDAYVADRLAAWKAALRMYSLKPVTLPTRYLPLPPCPRLGNEHPRRNARNSQNALIFVRKNFDELWQHGFPILQNPFGLGAASEFFMTRDEFVQ